MRPSLTAPGHGSNDEYPNFPAIGGAGRVRTAHSDGADAPFLSLELYAAQFAGPGTAAHGAQESRPPLWHHAVLGFYCMDAATMSLELHDRGIHAV